MMLIDADCMTIDFFPGPGGRILSARTSSRSGRSFRAGVSGWGPAETPSWTVVNIDPGKGNYSFTLFQKASCVKYYRDPFLSTREPHLTYFGPGTMGFPTKDEVDGFVEPC